MELEMKVLVHTVLSSVFLLFSECCQLMKICSLSKARNSTNGASIQYIHHSSGVKMYPRKRILAKEYKELKDINSEEIGPANPS